MVPGAILPSQQPGNLDGGSTNTSPSGAVAPPPADAQTWMVAATRVARGGTRGGARGMPAVTSLGALAAAGAVPVLAQPSAAAPDAAAEAEAEAAEAEPMDCGSPAGELASPEQGAEAEPVPAAEAPSPAEATPADKAATEVEEEAAPESEPAPSGGRRGRSRARAPAAATGTAAAEAAAGGRWGRSRGKPAAEAARELLAGRAAETVTAVQPEAAAEAAPAPRGRRGSSAAGKAAAVAPPEPPAEAPAAQPEAAAEAAPATSRRRGSSTEKAVDDAPGDQLAGALAVQPAASAGRRATRHTSAAGPAPEQATATPASKKRSARQAAGPGAAPEQAGAPADAPQPRPATRHTPVAPAAAAGEQPAAAAVEAAQPRRATRHTPVAPAAAFPALEQAAASKQGRKRRASLAAAEEAAAPAAAPAADQQPAATVDAARMAELASQLGCGKCRSQPSGCGKCRPAAVQALVRAGAASVPAWCCTHARALWSCVLQFCTSLCRHSPTDAYAVVFRRQPVWQRCWLAWASAQRVSVGQCEGCLCVRCWCHVLAACSFCIRASTAPLVAFCARCAPCRQVPPWQRLQGLLGSCRAAAAGPATCSSPSTQRARSGGSRGRRCAR